MNISFSDFRIKFAAAVAGLALLFGGAVYLGAHTGHDADDVEASGTMVAGGAPAVPAGPVPGSFEFFVAHNPQFFTRGACMVQYARSRGYPRVNPALANRPVLGTIVATQRPEYAKVCGDAMTLTDKMWVKFLVANQGWTGPIAGHL